MSPDPLSFPKSVPPPPPLSLHLTISWAGALIQPFLFVFWKYDNDPPPPRGRTLRGSPTIVSFSTIHFHGPVSRVPRLQIQAYV